MEIIVDGPDVESARADLEARVPDRFELVQVRVKKVPEGVQLTAHTRDMATTPISTDGAGYVEARDRLRAMVPDGSQLLGIRIDG